MAEAAETTSRYGVKQSEFTEHGMLQRLGPVASKGATHTPSSEIVATPQSEALLHSRWRKSATP